MTTYEQIKNEELERLLWKYYEQLQPIETEDEEELYQFLRVRKELVLELRDTIRKHVDMQSRKLVPSAILETGEFVPWYKFPNMDLTKRVVAMKNVFNTPVQVPFIAAIQRLKDIGIELTSEQMSLVRRAQAEEAMRLIPPRTDAPLKKHTYGIRKPKPQPTIESLKLPTTESGIVALLRALSAQGINLNLKQGD